MSTRLSRTRSSLDRRPSCQQDMAVGESTSTTRTPSLSPRLPGLKVEACRAGEPVAFYQDMPGAITAIAMAVARMVAEEEVGSKTLAPSSALGATSMVTSPISARTMPSLVIAVV